MDNIIVRHNDPNSGEVLDEQRFEFVVTAVGYAARHNQGLANVGYPPEYSVWIQDDFGRFEYRIDETSEQEL